MNLWPQIVLGWPFMALGCIFLIHGLIAKETWAAVVGALFSTPPSLYLLYAALPLPGTGLVALIGVWLGALAIWRRRIPWAAALYLPWFLMIVYLLQFLLRR